MKVVDALGDLGAVGTGGKPGDVIGETDGVEELLEELLEEAI